MTVLSRTEIIDALTDSFDGPSVNDRSDASVVADWVIDSVIDVLRGDRRFAQISAYELELLLADVRNDVDREIGDLIDDTVAMDDVIRSVKEAFLEEDED